jgi:hypothetical protein
MAEVVTRSVGGKIDAPVLSGANRMMTMPHSGVISDIARPILEQLDRDEEAAQVEERRKLDAQSGLAFRRTDRIDPSEVPVADGGGRAFAQGVAVGGGAAWGLALVAGPPGWLVGAVGTLVGATWGGMQLEAAADDIHERENISAKNAARDVCQLILRLALDRVVRLANKRAILETFAGTVDSTNSVLESQVVRSAIQEAELRQLQGAGWFSWFTAGGRALARILQRERDGRDELTRACANNTRGCRTLLRASAHVVSEHDRWRRAAEHLGSGSAVWKVGSWRFRITADTEIDYGRPSITNFNVIPLRG